MERQRPRAERARRNRMNVTFLTQRRNNPQYRLRLIAERHQSLSESNLPGQTQILSEKKEEK